MEEMCYTFTDENMVGADGVEWKLGDWQISHPIKFARGGQVEGWFNAYKSPITATVLFDDRYFYSGDFHRQSKDARLFCAIAGGKVMELHYAHKWCKRIKLIKEEPLPEIEIEERVALAILFAQVAMTDNEWSQWATKWLKNEDRTAESAEIVKKNKREFMVLVNFGGRVSLIQPALWALSAAIAASQGNKEVAIDDSAFAVHMSLMRGGCGLKIEKLLESVRAGDYLTKP